MRSSTDYSGVNGRTKNSDVLEKPHFRISGGYDLDISAKALDTTCVDKISLTPFRGKMPGLTKAIYGLFGEFTVLYGTLTLLFPGALHSEAKQSFHLAHNLREQGAATIFLGLMSL